MNQLNIKKYESLIFDCDGVVLNSNKIKTQAFFEAAKVYGEKPAQALVDYHVLNGGVSRYKKFEYFFTEILHQLVDQAALDSLLGAFAGEVKKGLMNCDVAKGLVELREITKHANWLIVSGGDQSELREVFAKRGIDKLFNAGIYGSPDTKDVILKREIDRGNITSPSLFLGDSKYDYEAARRAKLEFAYISDWSESAYEFDEANYKFSDIENILQRINA